MSVAKPAPDTPVGVGALMEKQFFSPADDTAVLCCSGCGFVLNVPRSEHSKTTRSSMYRICESGTACAEWMYEPSPGWPGFNPKADSGSDDKPASAGPSSGSKDVVEAQVVKSIEPVATTQAQKGSSKVPPWASKAEVPLMQPPPGPPPSTRLPPWGVRVPGSEPPPWSSAATGVQWKKRAVPPGSAGQQIKLPDDSEKKGGFSKRAKRPDNWEELKTSSQAVRLSLIHI